MKVTKPRKWVYILTGLMLPIKEVQTNTESVVADSDDDIIFERIGVRLKKVFLTEEDRIRKGPLEFDYWEGFIFYINDGMKDDKLAQSFTDAVMAAMALAYDLDIENIPTAVRITEAIIKKGKFIRIKDIIGNHGIGSEIYFRFTQSVGVPKQILDYVWRIVPYIVENKSLMDAAHFYRESIGQVWIADEDVLDIVVDNSDIPESQAEKASVETAYQNAFKAIEAIIGEPPKKDERKLRIKLSEAGINPDEKVGYNLYEMKPGKETILKKVVDMHQNRDKMAAHGKTITPRTIGYCELKDKQALARYILLSHINAINNKSLN